MGRQPPRRPRRATDVRLATTAAEVPPDAASLEEVLQPPPRPEWTGRHGIEWMWALGSWLRRLHAVPDPARHVGADRAVSDSVLPSEAQAADLDGIAELDGPHGASLANWSALLAKGRHLGHGRLGLDHVLSGDGTEDRVVVEALGGLAQINPAVDVGAVTGSLIELTHRARLRGDDAGAFERLLSAFLTGYRGFTSAGNANDLSVYRAAALQVALHARTHEQPQDRALDGQLARTLVEHCWTLGAMAEDGTPPPP